MSVKDQLKLKVVASVTSDEFWKMNAIASRLENTTKPVLVILIGAIGIHACVHLDIDECVCLVVVLHSDVH
jgi:hypothetical protein